VRVWGGGVARQAGEGGAMRHMQCHCFLLVPCMHACMLCVPHQLCVCGRSPHDHPANSQADAGVCRQRGHAQRE
jgi:hypothetical protein